MCYSDRLHDEVERELDGLVASPFCAAIDDPDWTDRQKLEYLQEKVGYLLTSLQQDWEEDLPAAVAGILFNYPAVQESIDRRVVEAYGVTEEVAS